MSFAGLLDEKLLKSFWLEGQFQSYVSIKFVDVVQGYFLACVLWCNNQNFQKKNFGMDNQYMILL